MPTPSSRSAAIRARVIASTGVASNITSDTPYIDHTKRGRRNHVMPVVRMVWIVTMKLSPVRIDEKPTMKTPTTVNITCEFENMVENGV